MRHLVERFVSIHRPVVFFVLDRLGRDVVKAFCPQEKTALGPGYPLPQGCRLGQVRIIVIGREPVIVGSTLRIESERDGDGLQQGRFPAAVLPDEKCERFLKRKPFQRPDRRNLSQVRPFVNLVPVEGEVVNIHGVVLWAFEMQR